MADRPVSIDRELARRVMAQDPYWEATFVGRSVLRRGREWVDKLTLSQVREIREQLANGVTGRVLAKRYGVWPATISSIKHRRTWRHSQ